MPRRKRLIVLPLSVALGVVGLSVACDDGTAGCRIDTDCPTGFICRGSICGLATPEAGVVDAQSSVVDAGGPTSCSGDGIFCAQPSDCCSQICAEGRCATSPSSTPLCKGLYQVCVDDCCTGFTCRNGSCQ